MLTITYGKRPAVLMADGQARLSPFIAVLEHDHPIRRWVMCMAYFALSVQDGAVAGPYTVARAEHFARSALMPMAEFAAVEQYGDAALAEEFGVPLEQVAERRVDLVVALRDSTER